MRVAISAGAGIASLLLTAVVAAQGKPQAPTPPVPTPPAPTAPASAPKPPPPAPKGKPTAHPDAPPAPPSPGIAPPPPPSPAPVFPTDSASASLKDPPIAGWHGAFFLRDPGDYFRLYPRGRLQLDFNSFPGAPTNSASLEPRFYARSLRAEMAGQFLQRWTFLFSVDFGGQALSNADGRTEQSAAGAGKDPTAASARYAPVQAISSTAVIHDAFINYSVCNCLNFMVGQHDVAFSMENETTENVATFMARSIGVRSFAVTSKKDLGLTIWGELLDARLAYAFEVLSGDGANRAGVDAAADFTGRIFTRPFLGEKTAIEKLQIGVSARTGQRDPKHVGYDVTPFSTGQGYALWQPVYADSLGRVIHVIPSGSQNEIGGELRLPISIFDLRGEAYYIANNTREAVDGYQLTNTERLGQMQGVAWYGQVSAWLTGDRFVNGDPGFFRPTTVNLNKELERPRRGLELAARVSGVNADYQGASRDGAKDAKTASKETGSKINIYEYAFGLNYWYTSRVRVTLDYTLYHVPDSATAQNRAVVPANLGDKADPKEHLLHELGARVGLWF